LKNRSILWAVDWQSRRLAPLYDLTSTTVYPQLDRQMGVALCESRVIDNVTPEDIANIASGIGVSSKMTKRVIDELLEGIERSSEEVVDEIISYRNRGSKSFATTTKDFYAEFTVDTAPRIKVLKACVD
jgi:serine/threonine-protein kinase HipA